MSGQPEAAGAVETKQPEAPSPVEAEQPQARIQANQRRLKELLKVTPPYLRLQDAASVNLDKPNTEGKIEFRYIMYKKRENGEVLSTCSNARGRVEDPRRGEEEKYTITQQVTDELEKLAQRLGGWPVAVVSGGSDAPLGKGSSGSEHPVTLVIDLTKPQLTEKLDYVRQQYQREKDAVIGARLDALVAAVNYEYPHNKDKAEVVGKALDTLARGTGVKASINVAGVQAGRKLGS